MDSVVAEIAIIALREQGLRPKKRIMPLRVTVSFFFKFSQFFSIFFNSFLFTTGSNCVAFSHNTHNTATNIFFLLSTLFYMWNKTYFQNNSFTRGDIDKHFDKRTMRLSRCESVSSKAQTKTNRLFCRFFLFLLCLSTPH